MGRERQKKKNRSSIRKVKAGPAGRTKSGRKKVNFLGNAIISDNWDRSLTLSQNYKKLGLSSRLNAPSGGVEKKPLKDGESASYIDPLAITSRPKPKTLKPAEARVERDPETGKIIRVIRDGNERSNPLNDPLNELSSPEPEEVSQQPKGVVADLEAQALAEEERLAQTRRPRQQSKREEEWVQRLIEAHGNDYRAMFRDRKLNPMQQSEGDLKRRVQKWLKKNASE